MTFTSLPDRGLIRAVGQSVRYVLVRIQAPAAPPRAGRPPVNMSFVLDRSGRTSTSRSGRCSGNSTSRAAPNAPLHRRSRKLRRLAPAHRHTSFVGVLSIVIRLSLGGGSRDRAGPYLEA